MNYNEMLYQRFFQVNLLLLIIVLGCWTAVVLIAKKHPDLPNPFRKPKATEELNGYYLQYIGFLLLFIPRQLFTSILNSHFGNLFIVVDALVAILLSFYFYMELIKERKNPYVKKIEVLPGKHLIVSGLYEKVRHPIFTIQFGFVLGTGIALSHWINFLIGMTIFVIGTNLRVKAIEQPIINSFNRDFADYIAKTRAWIPKIPYLFSRVN